MLVTCILFSENNAYVIYTCKDLKGRVMGPLLVSSCIRENAIVICKIVSFLCNLDDSIP